MKRLLIAVVALAGLLGSVMAVAVSVTSSASAQTTTATAQALVFETAERAAPAGANDISVRLESVNACANTGGVLSGGTALATGVGMTYTLTAGGQPVRAGSLSTACQWRITFSSVAGICRVSAQPKAGPGTGAGNAGSAVSSSDRNGLRLVGTGTSLTNGGAAVGAVSFSILRDASNCARLLGTPQAGATVTINVPAVPAAPYWTGLRFTPTVQPVPSSHAGCTQLAPVNLVSDTTTSVQATVRPQLVDLPLDAPPTAACRYMVVFPSEVGALSLDPMAAGHDATISAGDLVANATYVKTVVDVRVIAKYEEGEVFRTDESVDFHVIPVAPCGGYIAAFPSQYGQQGEVATIQPAAGSITAFGPSLTAITHGSKSYQMDAYADARGAIPCSVRVTEKNGPERCVPMGGNGPITREYVRNNPESFTFVFDHECDSISATNGDGGDDVTGTTGDGPPVPPSINLPGTGGDIDGPNEPKFTG